MARSLYVLHDNLWVQKRSQSVIVGVRGGNTGNAQITESDAERTGFDIVLLAPGQLCQYRHLTRKEDTTYCLTMERSVFAKSNGSSDLLPSVRSLLDVERRR